jgi:hypothetical protein
MQKYLKKIAFISLIIFFLPVCATKKKDDSLQTLILLFLLQSIGRSSSSAGTSTGTGPQEREQAQERGLELELELELLLRL